MRPAFQVLPQAVCKSTTLFERSRCDTAHQAPHSSSEASSNVMGDVKQDLSQKMLCAALCRQLA